MVPRLAEKYRNEIVPKMMERFGFKNSLEVPRIKKVLVNVGYGEAAQDTKLMDDLVKEIATITGQMPSVTMAKKAIAGFKIRKGSLVGCRVTLRKARMYEFMDRLINVAIPRIRDFRGLSPNSFDQGGNYSFGISEQSIFPELEIDKIKVVHGMDITIVMNAKSKEEAFELLRYFGVPFKR
ncbi:MAG: 50S ribosomal protein L5 [Candidatus Omnitrophica bacterium]|nr:50S ribosomal protein L5 [Candidatus Omnitrophota bacterium]